MAGYTETPLGRKLGITPGSEVHLVGAPRGYRQLLEPLPDGVKFTRRLSETTDLIHVFSRTKARLDEQLSATRTTMRADAVIWVSWPKKGAQVATDLTENVVRDLALPLGLVDVKVCAIDAVWSGLKLVVRKALR